MFHYIILNHTHAFQALQSRIEQVVLHKNSNNLENETTVENEEENENATKHKHDIPSIFHTHCSNQLHYLLTKYPLKQFIIVPCFEQDIELLNRNHLQVLQSNNIIALQNHLFHNGLHFDETFQLFTNKKKFCLHFRTLYHQNQVIPIIYTDISSIIYPCIIKPILGRGSHSVFICKNKIELMSIHGFQSHLFLIQEYIKNKRDYVAHFVAFNGSIVDMVIYSFDYSDHYHIKRYSNKYKIKQNETKFYLNSYFGYFTKQVFDKLLQSVNYNGIGCIDFLYTNKITGNIYDENTVYCNNNNQNNPEHYILEINPRLGGSLFYDENIDDFVQLFESWKLCKN